MSHFTCLVIIDNYKEKVKTPGDSLVDEALAPYMENCCGEPERRFMEFYDAEPEYRARYEQEKPEYIEMPDGRLLSPYDKEFAVKEKKSDENPFATTKQVIPVNLKRRNVDWSEIYSTFEQFVEDYCGFKKDPELDRYGYWQNHEKTLYQICLGSAAQITSEVKDYDHRRAILSGKEAQRPWNYTVSLLPVKILSELDKQDPVTISKAVLEREVWDYLGTQSVTPVGTKNIMADLFRSFDNGDKGLHYNGWLGGRQYRAAYCGNQLPHRAHVTGRSLFGGAKWDWFEIGGRWAGFFKLKKGEKGFQGKQYNFTQDYPESNRADVCFKKQLDLEGMRKGAMKRAQARWELARKVMVTTDFLSWEDVKEKFNITPASDSKGDLETARKFYWNQAVVQRFREYGATEEGRKNELLDLFSGPDEFQVPLEEYVERARRRAVTTHAFVRHGKWHEHGRMMMFATLDPDTELDEETWWSKYSNMLDELPDDAMLVLVDCHI